MNATTVRTITRTIKFEVVWPGLRQADLKAHWKQLWLAQDDLRRAGNHALLALTALRMEAIPWPMKVDASGNAVFKDGKPVKVAQRTLTYQLLSGKWQPFGKPCYTVTSARPIGSGAINYLSGVVHTRMTTDWLDIKRGNQSVATLKVVPLGCPLPKAVKLYDDGRIDLPLWAGRKNSRVTVRPRKLDGSLKAILCKLRSGEYKLGGAALHWKKPKNRKGKWFITLSWTGAVEQEQGETMVAGVDIGMTLLAAVAYSAADGTVYGWKDEVRYPEQVMRTLRRRQVEVRQRREHYGQRGKGRARAKRATAITEDQIRRVTRTALENAALGIVRTAKRRGATILAIEDHKYWSLGKAMDWDNAGEASKSQQARYRRRYLRWHQGELRLLLVQVGEREGLEVRIVNPAWSSRTCSACGKVWTKHGIYRPKGWSKTNAPDVHGRIAWRKFACSCGCKLHADHNAARNLAMWALIDDRWKTAGREV